MTQQGEGVGPHRDAVPAGAADGVGPEVPAHHRRHPSPRVWAALSCLLVAGLGAALWIDHSDGGGFLGGFGSSQDAVGSHMAMGPAPASATSAGPDVFRAERYFPAARNSSSEEGVGQTRRSAVREGTDCDEVVRGKALAPMAAKGCSGYIGATYVRTDKEVLTTITVLRFKDIADARASARTLTAHASDVAFYLPDDNPQDAAVPVAPAPEALFSRVTAVRGYVTITSAAFRDGHQPTAVDQEQLSEAAHTAAYAVGAQLMWL